MEKLRLPVESLQVETFDLGDAGKASGTVNAQAASGAGGGCCTRINTGCNPDVTLVLTGACVC